MSHIVVKIGGVALEQQRDLLTQIAELHRDHPVTIVHGGGKLVSSWLGKHDIVPEFVRGVRYTDETTLDVATAVLAGLVNSKIVALLRQAGAQSVGLSGVSLMHSEVSEPELGYVATTASPIDALSGLFESLRGFIPVVSPLVYNSGNGETERSKILNMNADTFAGYLAVSLKASRLILVTDKEGVLDTSQRLIPHLTPSQAEDLIQTGSIRGGMIPKIKACMVALSDNKLMQAHIVDSERPNGLIDLVAGKKVGTCIYIPQI